MTRVLIVDDSAVIRRVLADRLGRCAGIAIAGTASDPYRARDLIVQLKPDVVLLDVEMPRMDGLTFLRRLMRYHPLPVIVVSGLTPSGGHLALEALAAGAVDVKCKPADAAGVDEMADELAEMIHAAAVARLVPAPAPTERPDTPAPRASEAGGCGAVVAIGASTGGPQALELVLGGLPSDAPPVLVVQHMPPGFTGAFAQRLDGLCAVRVKEAAHGDEVRPGRVLIAPGDRHLLLAAHADGRRTVQVKDGPRVGGHRPSVDVLFRSVARAAGADSVGVLLTGMGDDGADALAEIRAAGGTTLAQDEATCVVFGMPSQAIRRGAAMRIVPIDRVAGEILAAAGRGGHRGG